MAFLNNWISFAICFWKLEIGENRATKRAVIKPRQISNTYLFFSFNAKKIQTKVLLRIDLFSLKYTILK